MKADKRNELVKVLSSLLAFLSGLAEEGRKDPEIVGPMLENTGFLDQAYYASRYPDVASSGQSMAFHYVMHGFHESRSPSELFEEIVPFVEPAEACKSSDIRGFIELLLKRVLARLQPDGSDTPARVLRQGSYEALYDLPLHVQWSVTSMCNYECSYCSYPYNREKPDKRKFTPFATMRTAVDNLAGLNRPAYEFVLLGGEPTVYPQLLELIHYIDSSLGDRLTRLTIVTNGSRDAAYFNQLADLARRSYIQIMFSIHTDHMRPEHVYELARELDSNLELNFLLMMNPARLELAREIFEGLCSLRSEKAFNLTLQTVYGAPDFVRPDPRYPDGYADLQNELQQKFLQIARDASPQLPPRSQTFHTFWELDEGWRIARYYGGDRAVYYQKGWLDFRDINCVGGAHLARIDERGFFSGVACGHFPTKLNVYEKGALRDASFMKILKCPCPSCVCSDNDILMKFAERSEAEEFLKAARKRQERLYLQEAQKRRESP